MKFSAWVVCIYALLIFLGGMIGYYQAHSLPSLIAGTLSAILLFACAWGMFKNSALAYTFALALILALALFFGYRFTLTGKFMPSGMMTLMSIFALAIFFKYRKKKAQLT